MYLLSDGISFLLCHVIRYRRAVVHKNLLIAFPEKTEAERKKIARQFYSYFTDNWLEFIKMISISKKELNKRFTSNYEEMKAVYDSGKNVQTHLGHTFNWEYAVGAYGMNTEFPFVAVYRPISNKIVDRIFYKVRTRFGSKLINAYEFKKEFFPYIRKRYALSLLADQKEFPGSAYWTPFFGKMTTFVQGPERTARLTNAAVLMANIKRPKRGYYYADIVVLSTDPRSLPYGEITKRMVAFIEESIRAQPANYLWSHNRWKYTFNAEKYTAL